jgi:hypothetical protein
LWRNFEVLEESLRQLRWGNKNLSEVYSILSQTARVCKWPCGLETRGSGVWFRIGARYIFSSTQTNYGAHTVSWVRRGKNK